MALRNEALQIFGTDYPNNLYEIGQRIIIPNGELVDVMVKLECYADNTLTYKAHNDEFLLKDLPNVPANLVPSLYETELKSQYATYILDGTALEDFTVV